MRSYSHDLAAKVAELDACAQPVRGGALGSEVAWRIWGYGPPVILLHGNFGSWTHWLKTIPTLARTHRVIAPDMPGFGDSDPMPAKFSISDIATRLHLASREIVEGEKVDIVGFSFGGMVAGELARLCGEDARKLVLVSSGRGLGIKYVPLPPLLSWRTLTTPEERLAAHRRNLEILMISKPERVDDLAVVLQARNAERTTLRYLRDETGNPLRRCLEQLTCDIAGIWGCDDPMIGPYIEERRDALRRIQPDAETVFIPDAGHWVQYEAPAAFDEALSRLLKVQRMAHTE